MQLSDLFEASLAGRRDRPGLDIEESPGQFRTLAFGEIDARANRMAHTLAAHGVTRGDRLAVYLSNRLEFLDLFLACLRLGAIFVPINILYREREMAHIVGDADPRLVIAGTTAMDQFPPGTPLLALEALIAEAAAAPDTRIRQVIDGDDPASIIYTSGTTGRSKGAVLTHNNLLSNTVNIVTCWQISEADRYLAVLPLFHVHGLANGVCAWLASGCRMRLVERFEHQRAEQLFAGFSPTLFFGVPTIYTRLLDLPRDAARRIGRQVRLFVSGSAPLPTQVFDAFAERFGHAILERYGMSETLMLMSNPYTGERRAGTVGSPLPGVSVRLVPPDGEAAAADRPSQILVRGPNVFKGYWRNPEATEAAFTDGWFHTGDLATQSADGYVTLAGRSSDLIISGGFNIYPREIEDVILDCPCVNEVVVVGAPDVRRGEVPLAYVVAEDGFDAEATKAVCVKVLASFKVPRGFVRVDALPRNALGKVQKHLLPPASSS